MVIFVEYLWRAYEAPAEPKIAVWQSKHLRTRLLCQQNQKN